MRISLLLLTVAALSLAQQPPPPPGGNQNQIKPGASDLIKVSIYADNWFMLYINGKLIAVDPIDFLPHNEVTVDILPEYPMTIAIMAKDNADPRTGLEYGNHIGDAGLIVKFSDGTVTNVQWKTKVVFRGPVNRDVNNPTVEYTAIPSNWYAPDFDDSDWTPAATYTSDRVKPDGNYVATDFTGADFIWSADLDIDNTVLFRYRVEKPGWVKRWNTDPELDNTCICPTSPACFVPVAAVSKKDDK